MAQPTTIPQILPLHNLTMSRNIRQNYPSTPLKVAKRRGSDSSSSLDLSDDDGYSGVEDVSESDEDDEEHVYAAEEDHIITNALRKRSAVVPPRPVEESDDADEEDGDEDEDDDDAEDDDAADDNAADDNASWDGILSDPEDNVPAEQPTGYIFDQDMADVEKHVRFTGVPDSDSDSTTSEASEDDMHDFFPDIFVAQNNLDPAFRKEIENDDNSSNSGSFWDFHNGSQDFPDVDSDDEALQGSEDTTPTITPMASQAPTEVSTPVAVLQELDGYECKFVLNGTPGSVMLIVSCQPTVTPQRRMSRSRLSAGSRSGAFSRPVLRPTPTPKGSRISAAASLVSGDLTWMLTRNLLRFSTP